MTIKISYWALDLLAFLLILLEIIYGLASLSRFDPDPTALFTFSMVFAFLAMLACLCALALREISARLALIERPLQGSSQKAD